MFSPEMTQAVNTAQTCLNACNNEENILLVAVNDIKLFCEYIDELDPSDIKFEKDNFFNNMIIKSYWSKFTEYYSAIEILMNKMKSDKNIISNTISTLNRITNDYNAVFDEFEKVENQDSDYLQQLIVAKNMKILLENTIAEYKTLDQKLDLIINISGQVFNMAISLIESSMKNSANSYKNRYAELRKAIV